MKYYQVSFKELSTVLGPLYNNSRQNYLYNTRAARLQSEAAPTFDDTAQNVDQLSIDTATSFDIKANCTTTSYEPSHKEQESENNQEISENKENNESNKLEHRKSRSNTFKHLKKFFHIGKKGHKNKNKNKSEKKSDKEEKCQTKTASEEKEIV